MNKEFQPQQENKYGTEYEEFIEYNTPEKIKQLNKSKAEEAFTKATQLLKQINSEIRDIKQGFENLETRDQKSPEFVFLNNLEELVPQIEDRINMINIKLSEFDIAVNEIDKGSGQDNKSNESNRNSILQKFIKIKLPDDQKEYKYMESEVENLFDKVFNNSDANAEIGIDYKEILDRYSNKDYQNFSVSDLEMAIAYHILMSWKEHDIENRKKAGMQNPEEGMDYENNDKQIQWAKMHARKIVEIIKEKEQNIINKKNKFQDKFSSIVEEFYDMHPEQRPQSAETKDTTNTGIVTNTSYDLDPQFGKREINWIVTNENDGESGKESKNIEDKETTKEQPTQKQQESKNDTQEKKDTKSRESRSLEDKKMEIFGKLSEFGELSEAQKFLIIEQFLQFKFDIIREDTQREFVDDTQKKISEVKDGKSWFGRQISKIKKGWVSAKQSIKKEFKLASSEKSKTNDFLRNDLTEADVETLKILADRAKNSDFDLEFSESGKINVLYAGKWDNYKLTPENQELIYEFNKIANEFANMSYEWSLDTAKNGQRKEYESKQKEFLNLYTQLCGLAKNKGNADFASDEFGGKLNQNIKLNQYIIQNQDIERQIKKSSNQIVWLRAFKNEFISKAPWSVAGAASRMLAMTGIGLIGGLIGAGTIGAIRSREMGKKDLSQVDKNARRGIKDTKMKNVVDVERSGKDVIYKRDESGNVIVDKEGRPIIDQEKEFTTGLASKIDKLIERINSEENEEKKSELIRMLQNRIDYTESKINAGLVNFGDKENRLLNQYKIMHSLSVAKAIGHYQNYNKYKKNEVNKRLEQLLLMKEEDIKNDRDKFLFNRARNGAIMSAGFFFAGYGARALFETFGWFPHHMDSSEDVIKLLKNGSLTERDIDTIFNNPKLLGNEDVINAVLNSKKDLTGHIDQYLNAYPAARENTSVLRYLETLTTSKSDKAFLSKLIQENSQVSPMDSIVENINIANMSADQIHELASHGATVVRGGSISETLDTAMTPNTKMTLITFDKSGNPIISENVSANLVAPGAKTQIIDGNIITVDENPANTSWYDFYIKNPDKLQDIVDKMNVGVKSDLSRLVDTETPVLDQGNINILTLNDLSKTFHDIPDGVSRVVRIGEQDFTIMKDGTEFYFDHDGNPNTPLILMTEDNIRDAFPRNVSDILTGEKNPLLDTAEQIKNLQENYSSINEDVMKSKLLFYKLKGDLDNANLSPAEKANITDQMNEISGAVSEKIDSQQKLLFQIEDLKDSQNSQNFDFKIPAPEWEPKVNNVSEIGSINDLQKTFEGVGDGVGLKLNINGHEVVVMKDGSEFYFDDDASAITPLRQITQENMDQYFPSKTPDVLDTSNVKPDTNFSDIRNADLITKGTIDYKDLLESNPEKVRQFIKFDRPGGLFSPSGGQDLGDDLDAIYRNVNLSSEEKIQILTNIKNGLEDNSLVRDIKDPGLKESITRSYYWYKKEIDQDIALLQRKNLTP